MVASSRGALDTVQELIASGEDDPVNATDTYGNTALIYAAAGGHTEVVRFLLYHGADVSAKNRVGRTAADRAAQSGHKNVLALLQAYGPVESPSAAAPPINMEGAALLRAAREGNVQRASALLASRSADANTRIDDKWTPLILATVKGHTEIIRLLLRHGADINARNSDGWTALRFAVSLGDELSLELLIAEGADENIPDGDGGTALMDAASEGNARCVEILLKGRVHVGAKNKRGETALMLAQNNGFGDCVYLIDNSGGAMELSRQPRVNRS